MMISPEMFIEHWKEMSYLDLIRERDRLIRDMRKYEKAERPGTGVTRLG